MIRFVGCLSSQEPRRGRSGSMLSQTMPSQRRAPSSTKGVSTSGAGTYTGGGGGGGGGGSLKKPARESDLRKILQSRHPFPPHFYLLLYMDRCSTIASRERRIQCHGCHRHRHN